MAGTLGSLIVDIGADVARLRNDMNKAQQTVNSSVGRIQATARSATRALSGVGGALVAAFSVRGLSRFVSETADALDEVGKLSQRLGITTEAVSRLQFVASQSGISFETLRGSLERLGKRAALAAAGQKSFADAFALVGLEAENFVNLPLDEQLLVIADAINKAQGSSQKLAAVSRILGDESRALVQAFGEGADGIQRLNDRADELNITVTETQAKLAAEFNDTWDETARIFQAVGRELAVTVLPLLKSLGEVVRDNVIPAVKGLRFAFRFLSSGEEDPRTIEEINQRLFALRKEVLKFQAQIKGGGTISRFLGFEDVAKNRIKEAQTEIERLVELREQLKQAERDQPPPTAPPPTAPPPFRLGAPTAPRLTEAENAQKQLEEQARRTIEALDTQQATLGLTSEGFAVYEARVLASKLQNEQLAEQLIATAESASAATAEFNRAAELQAQLASEGAQLTESLREPWEVAGDEIQRYAVLLENQVISQETFNRAVARSADNLKKATETVAEETEGLNAVWDDLGGALSGAFDAAVQETATLSDVLKGLEKDILRILSQQFSKGLTQQFSNIFGGGTGGGPFSFLSGLFGGGRQFGGNVRKGRFYEVGEDGPELFAPGASGQIIPAGAFGNGETNNTYSISVNGVGDRVDTASASQFATRIAQDLQRQLSRNT